jgi:hypothetical protein
MWTWQIKIIKKFSFTICTHCRIVLHTGASIHTNFVKHRRPLAIICCLWWAQWILAHIFPKVKCAIIFPYFCFGTYLYSSWFRISQNAQIQEVNSCVLIRNNKFITPTLGALTFSAASSSILSWRWRIVLIHVMELIRKINVEHRKDLAI